MAIKNVNFKGSAAMFPHKLPQSDPQFIYDDATIEAPSNSFNVETHYTFEGLDDNLEETHKIPTLRVDDEM